MNSPFAFVRQRFDAWWQQRHRPSDSWTLTQNNIYIVPTRAGLAFAITLVTLLIASINYQLNLGYVLTFLLAGSGLVSMNITHRTLRGLTLRVRPPEPVFAGDAALVEVVLTGTGPARYGIGLRARTDETAAAWTWVDVPAGGRSTARVGFVPHQRGLHGLPVLMAETRFPFGLFRAWTLWRPASQLLVYPAPERPAAPLPAAQPMSSQSSQRQRSSSGDFEGVRAWQRGDAMRRVVWKKVARTGELVSRDTHAATRQQLWLDYAQVHLPSVEERLSRLAAWSLAAERGGAEWGLRLPGRDFAPGHGDVHRRAVLEALALWS